jgi:serine/threonine protein kinase
LAAEKSMGQTACPNCGTLNPASDTYCSNCGFALDTTMSGTVVSGQNAATLASFSGRRITGALASGEMLGARYRIMQLIGKGGFSAVYQANDDRFQGQRRVAIKEMSDAHLSQTERVRAIANFQQEANILVPLKHPNLPDVSDFLEEGGKAYMVMEFIDGQTLEYLQDQAGSPLDEKLVMDWALQLCDVLDYLHNLPQPIIFRDLKPPNIMVTRTNQIKLIDFGIARIFKTTATKDTETLGSQGYAPLEQYGRGQSDRRSDIYALGATLYDLLTNSVPIPSPLRRIQGLTSVRQLNPLISGGVEQVVFKAMEELPDQRYQSASEMYDAIARMGFTIGRNTNSRLATTTGPNAPTFQCTQPGNYLPSAINPAPTQAQPHFQPQKAPVAGPPTQQTMVAAHAGPNASIPQPPGGSLPPYPAPVRPQPGPGVSNTPPPPTSPGTLNPATQRGTISRRTLLVGSGVALLAVGTGIYFFTRSQPGAQAATITINFAYSTEKSTWLVPAIAAFNTDQSKNTLNNKTIRIQANDLGSVDGLTQILNGGIKPIAWSPASNLEINRLNYKWQAQHGGNSIISYSDQFQPRSLVKSPLVLASWQDRAQRLLHYYKTQTLDWDTLASAFQVSSWADIGGEQGWGPVKFGQTLPTQSNSGLLTITLLAYHYFKEPRNLTTAQISNPDYWNYLQIFETAVSAFGHSSGTYLGNDLLPEGTATADVIATYESLVLTEQAKAKTLGKQPLLLYYPDLNILSDHPFAVLQGNWVTDEQKQAALQFRDYLLSVDLQRQALVRGFRSGNESVALDDRTVPGNPFVSESSIFPNARPDALQLLAPAPNGNIVDALITTWSQNYPTPNTTDG